MAEVTTEDEVVTPPLFELPAAAEPAPASPTRPSEARVLRPNRRQLQWLPHDLEAAVPPGHAARAIWGLLERLDLAAFYGGIKAVLDRPGRPTTDPRVLLAVWLLGTVEGIGSARRLAPAGAGWRGCATSTTPTGGCVVACPPTTTCSPTSAWPTRPPWTICCRRLWRVCWQRMR